MTVSLLSQGRAVAIRTKLTTTDSTAVYTCPPNHTAQIIGIRCANIDASNAVNITVTIVDSGSVIYTRYPTASLAAAAVIDFDLDGHPLKATETLNVQASSTDDIHVTGTAIERPGAGG